MKNKIGKTIGSRVYIHIDELPSLSPSTVSLVKNAQTIAKLEPFQHFNVLRIDKDTSQIAFLNYPDFFERAFPQLKESWRADTATGDVSYRTYENSLNPPILHRKELLIAPTHARANEYRTLTESAETLGLFDDTTRIGYQAQWNHLIKERGYELVGHNLAPIGNNVSEEPDASSKDGLIHRHRTALVRYDLSAPIKSLARYGFLDGGHTLFDYGCGRGDDVRGLIENDIEALGWDPHFAPNNDLHKASIVNLGFVINVIEDFDERVEALARAYSLANSLLVVSVMITNDNSPKGRLLNDGIVTQRGTFQKYYTQTEISTFIEQVLDESPIPIGPGIFYVFRDKDSEQRFLAHRYRSRRNLLRSASFSTAERNALRQAREDALYKENKFVLDALWNAGLWLGRKPDATEFEELNTVINKFGTLNKAWRFISSRNNPEDLDNAQKIRIADLSVYLALREFEQRKGYRHLESGLKRDIKNFFSTIGGAKDSAQSLLFSISNEAAINEACKYAAEHGLGHLLEGQSLQLHTSLVEQLPPILRVYCGCATALYGDYRNVDLIKIHINSGKLTLMRFDDFENNALPRMTERVKLKLREQDIEYFSYEDGEYTPPYLYCKSRYINEEFPHYPEQVEFDTALCALDFLDLSGYGLPPDILHTTLEKHRWEINRFQLTRIQSLPDLDSPCGEYLTYRDLIECGETQKRTEIPNLPKEPDTYSALLDLAAQILDPVIEYYGMIKLTYGFCSPELEKHIKEGIAPKLDQHSGHERRRTGRFICDRQGAAIDFLVEDENMMEVANWLANNTPYDRLYFYGDDLPIHVSFSKNPTQSLIDMRRINHGKRLPRRINTPII